MVLITSSSRKSSLWSALETSVDFTFFQYLTGYVEEYIGTVLSPLQTTTELLDDHIETHRDTYFHWENNQGIAY